MRRKLHLLTEFRAYLQWFIVPDMACGLVSGQNKDPIKFTNDTAVLLRHPSACKNCLRAAKRIVKEKTQ